MGSNTHLPQTAGRLWAPAQSSNCLCVLWALGGDKGVTCLKDPVALNRSHRWTEKPLVHKGFLSQISLSQRYEARWREAKSQCLCKLWLSTSIVSISLWGRRGGGRTSNWIEWEPPSGNDSTKAGKHREDLGRNMEHMDAGCVVVRQHHRDKVGSQISSITE